MNERIINDLAVKSGLAEDMGRGYKFPDNYLDFAQLIVRECVSIVAKRKDQAIDDGWNVDEAMSMAEMDLEEHFGVEE